jgi:predicted lipoprotein
MPRTCFGLTFTLALILSPLTARADVAEVVQNHILPGYTALASAAAALDATAQQDCTPATLPPAFHTTFDAWMAVQHLHLGPVEEEGRGLAVAFWPDPKGRGLAAQRVILANDPATLTPDSFADQSIAARGLMALERLLYPDASLQGDTCALIRLTTADLARTTADIATLWQQGFAASLTTAGQPGNTRFLSQAEARQALLTQLTTGLEHLADQRIARPMGSFDKPRPDLAEARASGRSLRNITLSLHALRDLSATLSPDTTAPLAAIDTALAKAGALDDPILAGTADPAARLRIEILQQSIRAARDSVVAALPPALGVGIGFNALDGD